MRKLIFLSLAALMLPVISFAQFSISGRVTDHANQEPLVGASVSIGSRNTQTNGRGEFTIENIDGGNYNLRVSFLGFRDNNQSLTVKNDQYLNISLWPSSFVADEVIVRATRAADNDPTTFSKVNKQDLEKNNFGQDLPYLLNQTPSVVVSSDAGTGIGYTGIRIRGSDPTRINVTINGIPYNDPESQGTFWVNLPDFASSVDNIQIQRGVGSSTNGAGAFGGSLNIQTTSRRDTAYAELNNSTGSFNTWKNTVNVGTGLIKNKFTFDGRLSRVKSDGYIDRGSSDLKSYFLSGAFYGNKDLLRVNVFSGSEKTYQAWGGVPESLLASDRTYNYFTYDDQTDNYTQNHYQALYSRSFSDQLSVNAALHYTKGSGYFEEYQEGDSLKLYNIAPVTVGNTTIETSDLIRRRWLSNDFYGLTYSANYFVNSDLNLTLGGAYNEYDGDHFGEVIWARYASNSNIRSRYYDNNGFKTDFNVYGRGNYRLGKANLYADLQFRSISYSFLGYDRNLNNVQQKTTLDFFNPKFGLTYNLNASSNVYASFSIANKEPNRDDYTQSTPDSRPKPENLKNVEVGYRASGRNLSGGINAYGMFYKDQLILTGRINDVGEYNRQNVPNSYRIGVELDGAWKVTDQLRWNATAAFSENKIKNFTSFNDSQVERFYKKTDIAFSPSFIASSEISLGPLKNTEIALLSKYVGKQYLDNTQDPSHKIDPFFVNDIRLSYHTSVAGIKDIGLSLMVINVFNEIYESNGYIYYGENYYFPQATRNYLLSLNIKF